MAAQHYVRILGGGGGVDPCEGPAIGIELSALVADGLPPWRVALEITAGLAEILAVCEEDSVVHGAVRPEVVFVDETGAVSLEGFGQPNAAPEGGVATSHGDAYGLGRVLAALAGSPPLPRGLEGEAYDDAVVDLILETPLDGLPSDMQGDLQWFLGRLLARSPGERPMAVDVWRTLLAFARAVEGPDVPVWCDQALDGGGERRADPTALSEEPSSERLDGVVRGEGPLTGPMAFEPTHDDGKPGTGFFTREQLRRGLEAAEAPQGVGGGRASGHWSQDELAAMRSGRGAPAPSRGEGEVARARTMIVPKKVTSVHRQERATAARPRSDRLSSTASPVPVPARATAPAAPVRAAAPAPEAGGSGLLLGVGLLVTVAVVASLVCAGLGGATVMAAWLSGG